MTLEEIFEATTRITRTQINLFSYFTYRSDDLVNWTCIIKRDHEGDRVEISRDGKSALEAATASWEAFRKIVTSGYEPQDLAPVMLVYERPITETDLENYF